MGNTGRDVSAEETRPGKVVPMKDWTRLSRIHARIAVGFSSLVIALYLFIPGIRKQLTKEDRFLEEATAWIFLAGFLAGAFILVRLRRSHFRLWYVIVPALCLLGLLDEISFGDDMFDLDMPRVQGKTIDGAHDFVDVAYRLMIQRGGTMGWVILGLIGVASLFVLFWGRRKIFMALRGFPPLKFCVVFVLCLAVALPFDLEILP